MKHFASPQFWFHYRALPVEVKQLANKCFELMKADPRHPSIHLKHVGEYRAARIGLHYRALGVDDEGGISWFWIGSHAVRQAHQLTLFVGSRDMVGGNRVQHRGAENEVRLVAQIRFVKWKAEGVCCCTQIAHKQSPTRRRHTSRPASL